MHQLSADEVMAAVNSAAKHLPHLQIVVATNCDGHAWLVDPDRSVVYLDGNTSISGWSTDLIDALDALRRYHQVPHPGALRLVPQLPSSHADACPTITVGWAR